MNKDTHCNRCAKETNGKKYNPYNVTFKHHYFDKNHGKINDDDGFFCSPCAVYIIKMLNLCKGGHWVKQKPEDYTI